MLSGSRRGLRDKPHVRPGFYHLCYSVIDSFLISYHYLYDPHLRNGRNNGPAFKWVATNLAEGGEGIESEKSILLLRRGEVQRIWRPDLWRNMVGHKFCFGEIIHTLV
jgi:hypothetical protein